MLEAPKAPSRPDIVQMGPANTLVSVAQIARELGISREATERWLAEVGVPVKAIENWKVVGLGALEAGVWAWTGGHPDEMGAAGLRYQEATRTAVRARLRAIAGRKNAGATSPPMRRSLHEEAVRDRRRKGAARSKGPQGTQEGTSDGQ